MEALEYRQDLPPGTKFQGGRGALDLLSVPPVLRSSLGFTYFVRLERSRGSCESEDAVGEFTRPSSVPVASQVLYLANFRDTEVVDFDSTVNGGGVLESVLRSTCGRARGYI